MLMGSETEFGILGGWTLKAANKIQRRVQASHAHLRSSKEGVFLGNGGRVYVDLRCQNEYCTPEVDDPLLLVRHELAGRALMRTAAAASGQVMVCSNVDYSSLNAWGTHENYECHAALDEPAAGAMLTHLATRIVFSGAGGPHPGEAGMRFVMSPRAAITRVGRDGQGSLAKAMIYRKPEDYGAGHRLHVFCGESLLCPRASWLKYGSTALVAHCLDAGLIEPRAVTLRDPLRTLHALNRDVGFGARFAMLDGAYLSGLEAQLRLVDAIEERLASLPPWAGDVLVAWRWMLGALRARDEQLYGMVDWLLYRRLWLKLAEEHGFRADQLPSLQREIVLGVTNSPAEPRERYLRLCDAARELYVRLHALDDASPCAAAAAAGWLEQPLPGLEDAQVQRAIKTAPAGRAGNRARLVRTLRPRSLYRVSWDTVHDFGQLRSAAIPHDPEWSGQPEWEFMVDDDPLPLAEPNMDVRLLGMVAAHGAPGDFRSCFRTGDYDDGLRLLAAAGSEMRTSADPMSVVLSHARMGRRTVARRELDAHPDACAIPFIAVATRLFCSVNYGLVPPLEECLPLIREGEELLPNFGDQNPEPDYHRAVFDQCSAWVWLHHGRVQDAIDLLEATILALRSQERPRMLARTSCLLAEAHRRKGDVLAAAGALMLPARIYIDEELAGDAVDHYVPVLARLGDPDLPEAALHCAEVLQRRRGHDLGLARTLCLRARLGHDGGALPELRALAHSVEVLRGCALMRRILAEWDAWVNGERSETEDLFWGL